MNHLGQLNLGYWEHMWGALVIIPKAIVVAIVSLALIPVIIIHAVLPNCFHSVELLLNGISG